VRCGLDIGRLLDLANGLSVSVDCGDGRDIEGLTCFTEDLIALLEVVSPGFQSLRQRHNEQTLIVAFLKTVREHWSVLLLQHVLADLDDQIRAYAENGYIESGVVDLAERESVVDPRVALGMPVRQNMGGVEKPGVPQPADGTALPVGLDDPVSKALLV